MKKVLLIWVIIFGFGITINAQTAQNNTFDQGVVINGVKWATRNVDTPGTFAANPEDAGMIYQWNCKIAWSATGSVTGRDSSPANDEWEKSNDPSPVGWRVPSLYEIYTLCNVSKVSQKWTTVNGINGIKFTDIASGNSIFLPAAGYRYGRESTLGNVGSIGYYWNRNSMNNSGGACLLLFNSSGVSNGNYIGDYELWSSIRSVAE